METAMPRSPASTVADHFLPQAGGDRQTRSTNATELNRPVSQAVPDGDTIGAGAEIFRRLERRPRRRKWTLAITLGVLAVFAAGGVIAFQTVLRPGAEASSHTQFISPGH
jgi:hypothetical protein